MEFSVKNTLKDLAKDLTHLQREQIPFATAQALTKTAWNAREFARDGMEKDIENPKAFTLNAFAVQPANKKTMKAAIYLKSAQANYLGWVIEGGAKHRLRIGVPPGGTRARMTPARYRRELNDRNTFIGHIKNVYGLWRRMPHRRLKLVVGYVSSANYPTNQYEYYKYVSNAVDKRFPVHWNESMKRAIETAGYKRW